MWSHPIDIIIVGHAYQIPIDHPITTENIHKDRLYQEIQALYGAMAAVAREVVFVPVGHFQTGIDPHMGILQRRILYNQGLSMFRTPLEVSLVFTWFSQNLSPNKTKLRCGRTEFPKKRVIFAKNRQFLGNSEIFSQFFVIFSKWPIFVVFEGKSMGNLIFMLAKNRYISETSEQIYNFIQKWPFLWFLKKVEKFCFYTCHKWFIKIGNFRQMPKFFLNFP